MRASSTVGWAIAFLGAPAFAIALAGPEARVSNPHGATLAQKAKNDLTFPPALPDGKEVVTDTSEDFLKAPESVTATVAKTAPTIDFLYCPGQVYTGNPWSNWGDSLAVNGKYYASIGDHLAVGSKVAGSKGTGTALIYEYDPQTKKCRVLADVSKTLNLPEGHYTPGKVHGRLDMGSDGWLYCSTHRGSTKVTTDKNHYLGDWIIRCHPESGKTEVVVQGPVAKHCIPNSVLDPDRLIFYGGTAPGTGNEDEGIQFFAYDVKNKKLLYAGPDGPSRYMMFARSTGRVYYTQNAAGKSDGGILMRYHPDENGGKPVKVEGKTIGLRSATQETPQGIIYTVSQNPKGPSTIWSFNVKTEEIQNLGPAAVGSQQYVASLDADPTGRYLYYVPGAHGSGLADGSAVVQFDVKTRQKKVIAFLHPFYLKKYGCALKGTYSSAVDGKGDKLYITWNAARRESKAWDCCALTVIHIPEAERQP